MDTADSLTAIRHAISMHDRVKEYVANGIDTTIDVMEDLLEYTSGNYHTYDLYNLLFSSKKFLFNRNENIQITAKLLSCIFSIKRCIFGRLKGSRLISLRWF